MHNKQLERLVAKAVDAAVEYSDIVEVKTKLHRPTGNLVLYVYINKLMILRIDGIKDQVKITHE